MYRIGKIAALGSAAALFALAAPAFAQTGGANNMPADQSTPAERAETRTLNQAIVDANRAADAKAAAAQQHYESERAQYSEQQARYRDAMGRHARQQDAYAASRNAYGLQRARYNAALIHHQHNWPDDAGWGIAGAAPQPKGMRVQFLDGASAGVISDVARGTGGLAEAFLVQLKDGAKAWIESADLRFNAAAGVFVTDLDARDIQTITAQNAATP